MKKIVIGSLAVASVVLLSSCEMPGQQKKMDAMPAGDSMMQKEDVMMEKGDAMVKNSDAMMQKESMEKEDAMMKKEEISGDAMMKKNGEYTAYSTAAVDTALASGKRVALFFHAAWCPTCKALDKTLSAENIPTDVVVFKVDYDNSSDLKKQYGVTGQHTIVTLDAQKNMIKKERGSQNIADIVKLF